jgi:exosome complex exonuclease RRP6
MAGPNLLSAASFDEFNSQLQTTALKATRNAALLPSDVRFHRSMDASFARDLDALSQRALVLSNRLLSLAGVLSGNEDKKGKRKLEDQDDVVDRFQSLVVDSMDQLLERTVC